MNVSKALLVTSSDPNQLTEALGCLRGEIRQLRGELGNAKKRWRELEEALLETRAEADDLRQRLAAKLRAHGVDGNAETAFAVETTRLRERVKWVELQRDGLNKRCVDAEAKLKRVEGLPVLLRREASAYLQAHMSSADIEKREARATADALQAAAVMVETALGPNTAQPND